MATPSLSPSVFLVLLVAAPTCPFPGGGYPSYGGGGGRGHYGGVGPYNNGPPPPPPGRPYGGGGGGRGPYPPPPPPPASYPPRQQGGGYEEAVKISGRAATHPSQVPRFKKYFPGPPKCDCKYPENPLDLGRSKRPAYATGRRPLGRTTTNHLPTVELQPYNGPDSPTKVPTVDYSEDGSYEGTYVGPVDRVATVYENGYMFDATGGDAYDHSFHSHSHEWENKNKDDPCPKESNVQIELADGTKNFIFTSKNPNCGKKTWDQALDFCQKAGMQAVSLGADRANEDIAAILDKMRDPEFMMDSFWTSGSMAKPSDEGDNRQVTWTSATMGRTEEVVAGMDFWATEGLSGVPQPDNHAGKQTAGKDENCVAAAISLAAAEGKEGGGESDSPGLHDLPCDAEKFVVCEEREALMGADSAEGLSIYM